MPLVTVQAQRAWLPHELDSELMDPLVEYEPMPRVTYMLGGYMPQYVAMTMARFEREWRVGSEEVRVDFAPFHARSFNAPDIWVHVAMMGGNGKESKQDEILAGLQDMITGAFAHQFYSILEAWPTIEIDLTWQHGCGVSLDEEADVIARWSSGS